jgi:hypothetical protein
LPDRFCFGRPGGAAAIRAAALLAVATVVLSACTGHPAARSLRGDHSGAVPAADVALVRFTSCDDALRALRYQASTAAPGAVAAPATGAAVPTAQAPATASGQSSAAATGAAQASSTAGSYSGTTTATPGVDEPDLVKTDGRQIVTVIGGVLRVVDAETQQLTGSLDLSAGSAVAGWAPASLLLAGGHALVLFNQTVEPVAAPMTGAGAAESGAAESGAPVPADQIQGPLLELIDLSTGVPQVISTYTIDGTLVDARQVGSIARVVIQSAPRIYEPPVGPIAPPGASPGQAATGQAGLSQWLPRFAVTTGGTTRTGLVNCSWVSHPAVASYTGSSMLTVLTFDLGAASLGDGEPITVVADGGTVYSDGTSLYIASREWAPAPVPGPVVTGQGGTGTVTGSADAQPAAVPQYTAIYKFDISAPGRPVYDAAGSVPGWLLGSSGTAQYSLSAWQGALRVATTSYDIATPDVEQPTSQSAVYVLEQFGGQLYIVGKAGGLGAGEQIYAVRFAGPVGYVATFRQTDPLYTLDLSDPAQPRVTGELMLSGYSAFLYPVDASHVIGIGQAANALGQTTGTQISLFDVSDLAAPVLLATYDLQFGHSQAEFDPHAFLYWAPTRLLVIPVQLPYATPPQPVPPTPVPPTPGGAAQSGEMLPYWPVSEALVLHVSDNGFTELGTISHPATPYNSAGGQILRSLVIDNALWTLSDAGLKANDIDTLSPLGWVPFSPG